MSLSTEPLLRRVARLDQLNANLTFRIARLAKLLEVEGTERLDGSGINLSAYRIMLVVEIFEELSVSDISRLITLDRAQVSRAASELIEKGLLEARADQRSKRKKLLALTAAGRAQQQTLKARFTARQQEIETLLGDETLSSLWHAIDQITGYLETRATDG